LFHLQIIKNYGVFLERNEIKYLSIEFNWFFFFLMMMKISQDFCLLAYTRDNLMKMQTKKEENTGRLACLTPL